MIKMTMQVTTIPKKTVSVIPPPAQKGPDRSKYDQLRVAPYCRVSTDSEEQLTSYTMQKRVYTEMIMGKPEWQLVDIYADEGISGTRADKRDEFQRMIRDCRRGKIDYIITKSVSRFARNTAECIEFVRQLKLMGIGVIFEEQNMLYVMSDIHGHLQRFESIMDQIKLGEGDHLFVLGDVIDIHPDGIQILQKLLRMQNVTLLLGNHELMMCRAVYKPATDAALNLWFKNGGKPTYEAWKKLTFPEQVEIIYKLQRCPLNTQIEIGGKTYLLAHGSPMELFDPATSKYNHPEVHTVWARIEPDDEMPKGKLVIFGHTPTFIYQPIVPMAVWVGKQKIAIDCGSGCEYGGRLACLRLDDMKVFYSEEKE